MNCRNRRLLSYFCCKCMLDLMTKRKWKSVQIHISTSLLFSYQFTKKLSIFEVSKLRKKTQSVYTFHIRSFWNFLFHFHNIFWVSNAKWSFFCVNQSSSWTDKIKAGLFHKKTIYLIKQQRENLQSSATIKFKFESHDTHLK